MVKQIDSNNDGKIDMDEFMVMMKRREMRANRSGKVTAAQTYEQELLEAFQVFDKDGDGNITASELASTMKALGENLDEDDIKFMMSEVDTNNDGNIDFQEFKKMMSEGPK